MIKKIVIRILLVFMLAAFLGVVLVQWYWIKYAVQERQNRFSSKVYDVLNRTVNRVDEINYVHYWGEMTSQLKEIRNFNKLARATESMVNGSGTSAYLTDFLKNDIERLNAGRSYLTVQVTTNSREPSGTALDQKLIIETLKTMDISTLDSVEKSSAILREKLKAFMIHLVEEKNPQNVSVWKRLEYVDLRHILASYFQEMHIRIPFQYEILTKKDVLDKVRDNKLHDFYYVPLFPNDYVPKDYYLGVRFESIQSVVMENMGWLFLASAFCVLGLMAVFIITIVIIMRQQRLSVVKNDFINNMTHEFKTPIATISLATSAIMKEKVLDNREQLLKFNDMIRSENNRMNTYVERILQQARLDRKEIHLNRVKTDIHELIREAVGHFMLQVQLAGGKLILKLEASHFVMEVDEVHMMNVVCNLLDNAIKYSGGIPEIEVTTRLTTTSFIIGIRDQGIGISREAQKKVFKRFYRVTTGNLHNVKGFGLGLSYVKSIVELHGGTVHLTSARNKGTLVEIEFKKEQLI